MNIKLKERSATERPDHNKVIAILRDFTSIRTPEVIEATVMHLCDNISVAEATERAGASSRATVNRACNRVLQIQELILEHEAYRYVSIPKFIEEEAVVNPIRLHESYKMSVAHKVNEDGSYDVRVINEENWRCWMLKFTYGDDQWWLSVEPDQSLGDSAESFAAESQARRYLESLSRLF